MKALNILIVGSGGREHALALACEKSEFCTSLHCVPGNDAIASFAQVHKLAVEDAARITQYALDQSIDLAILGPEAALVAGVGDALRARGIAVLGPDQAPAEIEGSKIFAKEFMDKYDIPTARWSKHTELNAALADLKTWEAPPVVKADGLAAGKGVTVATSFDEAESAIRDILENNKFGDSSLVLEENLIGEEVSWMALCDGTAYVSFPPSQDHKRIFDGDEGPNTGGMGAYAPTSLADDALEQQVRTQVLDNFVRGMKTEGYDYKGVIYAGLMVHEGRAKVLEFNARFGDPECQILLGGLKEDFVQLAYACATGTLKQNTLQWADGNLIIVIAASAGYPESSSKGDVIEGLEDQNEKTDATVIHAGTALTDGQWCTAGGRVLGVVAEGSNIKEAQQKAYARMDSIAFEGKQVRRDIGYREAKRQG